MLIPNLLAALAQEDSRMLTLRSRALAPKWLQEVPKEFILNIFSVFWPQAQMTLGSIQEGYFRYFRASATRWSQGVPSMFVILRVF